MMKVAGHIIKHKLEGETYIVSYPYCLPTSPTEFFCSVKPKVKGSGLPKFTIIMPSKDRGLRYKKFNLNTINFLEVSIADGVQYTTHCFASSSELKDWLADTNAKNNELSDEAMRKSIETSDHNYSDLTTFEKLARDEKIPIVPPTSNRSYFEGSDPNDDIYGDITASNNDIDALMLTWETFFEDKAKITSGKAKLLLVNISNHYLTKEMINGNLYLKSKLSIQSDSLSLLFLQLDLTKNVLLKSFKEIMSGMGGKPIFDLFSQQQRLVLDINTFISSTIKEIISDLDQAKIRHIEREAEIASTTIDQDAEQIGETIIVRDKSKLLKDLELLIIQQGNLETVTEEEIDRIREERDREINNI